MSSQTTFTQFGPDPPLSQLPQAFQTCLPPNAPSANCDNVVGSLATGQGYCSQPQYDQTTYCACVNNAIPCPMVAAAACANSAFAYVPTAMQAPNGQAYQRCKGQPICVNIVEIGGSQNIVSGITQQCGIITNIQNIVSANPTLAILAFLLFITLIVLMSIRTGGTPRATPPPPPPGTFGDMPSFGGPPAYPF